MHETTASTAPSRPAVMLVVVVAALGYFVDIFDLLLFGLVRKKSLIEIMQAELAGKSPEEVDKILSATGIWLDSILQTTGLLVGGLVWGIIADRFGRLKVLFGSILAYSLANLANAFVQDVQMYGVLRFVAEYFREPDSFLGLLALGLSMGQWLCLPMVAAGVWLMARPAR